MPVKLPRGLAAYFDAGRTGDPDAVAAAFTETGIVKDEGKLHQGREAIRDWMAEAAQRYGYTAEPFLITDEQGRIQVSAHVTGRFPGSPIDLRFLFLLAADRIAALEITA